MDPVVLAALISLISVETAGLLAAIGYMIQRKQGGDSSGRPAEWELHLRELANELRENSGLLHELKWILVARTKHFDDIAQSLRGQATVLSDIAREIQRAFERRRP